MSWVQVLSEEYDKNRPHNLGLFHSAAFNNLNAHKVDKVEYWLYKDNKFRFGIIVGYDGRLIKSPFSSPIGSIECLTESVDIEKLNLAIRELCEIISDDIKLIVPPAFYNENLVNYSLNSFFNNGFKILYQDINYHFETKDLDHYTSLIDRSAKKNLNKSLSFNYEFVLCHSLSEKKLCYEIIKQNRLQRGFPLRLSFNDLTAMENLTQVYYNLLKIDGNIVASSISYKVSEKYSIVVYWGNLVEYNHLRPMNLLAFNLFHQMKTEGFTHIDIGHSTENGIPNFGLCKFKENIGCKTSLKYTLLKSHNG